MSASSVVFQESVLAEQVDTFTDALRMSQIGVSWGGTNSLAMPYPDLARPNHHYQGRLVWLNAGLGTSEDLITDLRQTMAHAAIQKSAVTA